MTDYIEVRTTIDSRSGALKIAESLVARHLAACVQVSGPMTSTYWWQQHVEQAEEWLCVAKTRADRFAALEQAIKELHPYAIPEIIATAIVAGNIGYLEWIEQATMPNVGE